MTHNNDQSIGPDATGCQARRRVVTTKHALPLSALLSQFRDSGFARVDSNGRKDRRG
jgi:hypothetical protein